MFNRIYQQMWLSLDKETRDYLQKVFNIQKSSITEIRDNQVLSDGVTNQDLEVITSERLSEYTESPVSIGFPKLWEIALSKVKYELHPPAITVGAQEVPKQESLESLEEVKPKKHAKNQEKKSK